MLSHPPEGSLRVRATVADALLAGVSPGLDREAVEGVLDCGFSATLAAVRNGHELLDWDEFPTRRAL